MTTLTEATTRTIDAPGATADLRRAARHAGNDIPLFLIGSPMGAAGFATLASHFPDRTIITYDPRGAERSTKDDPTSPSNRRPARRRPASDHPGGRRPGRPVRQQRWRGERARAGREASRGRADPRRARAAARLDPARQRERQGGGPRDPELVPGRRVRSRDGALHRHHRATAARSPTRSSTSRRPIRRCSGCRPRTTAAGPM